MIEVIEVHTEEELIAEVVAAVEEAVTELMYGYISPATFRLDPFEDY